MRTTWNPYAIGAFEAVFRPWMWRRMDELYVRGVDIPDEDRVILAANHVSWWDAFLLRELHRDVRSEHRLFTIMRAEQLSRHPWFAKMGVIEIADDPGSIRRALRRLFTEASPFWLTYFPQGSIWPSWKRPLGFRRGLELFARELAPCVVVPIALHLEPLAAPSPSVFIGIGDPLRSTREAPFDVGSAERAVEHLLDELLSVLAAEGERAGPAWSMSRSRRREG